MIRTRLGLNVDEARKLFVQSPGALVANRATGRVFRVGTITPARKPDGSCVFLTEEGRCSIHEDAPAGCAFFDTHMDVEEAARRSNWLVVQQQQAQYKDLRRTFAPAVGSVVVELEETH